MSRSMTIDISPHGQAHNHGYGATTNESDPLLQPTSHNEWPANSLSSTNSAGSGRGRIPRSYKYQAPPIRFPSRPARDKRTYYSTPVDLESEGASGRDMVSASGDPVGISKPPALSTLRTPSNVYTTFPFAPHFASTPSSPHNFPNHSSYPFGPGLPKFTRECFLAEVRCYGKYILPVLLGFGLVVIVLGLSWEGWMREKYRHGRGDEWGAGDGFSGPEGGAVGNYSSSLG